MNRRSIAALLCAALAACGGGGGRTTSPAVPSLTQPSSSVRGSLVVHVPTAGGTSAAQRQARFVSAATKSASVKIAPASGCAQCSAPLTLEAGLTPASAGCTTNASGTTCSIALGLLPGSYTGTMSTYDGPLDAQGTPTGRRLSVDRAFPIAITSGSPNAVGVTLAGIPSSLKLTPKSNFYTGGVVAAGAVVPVLRLLGPNAVGQAIITAYDVDGNAIAGAGAPNFTLTSPNVFTVSVAGNVATITAPATVTTGTYELTLQASGPGCAEPEAQCLAYPPVGFEQLLAIADPGTGSGAVYLIPADVNTFTPLTTITNGINGPGSVAFAPDGTLFVANSAGANVAVYAPPYTGAPTVVTSGITDPRLIALAPNKTLFVANRTGAHVTVLPPPYTTSTTLPVQDARGFAFDSAAKAYISDYANNAIVSASLPYTSLAGNTTSGPITTLNGPSGLAVNAQGKLWVANTLGNSLLRFSQFGSNASPSATITAGNNLASLSAPTAVAVVNGGATLISISPSASASFNEATQVTLLNPGLRSSPTSKIAVDLAGTAWFTYGAGGQYYGFAYPYSDPNGAFNVFGAPLTAPADIAVFP